MQEQLKPEIRRILGLAQARLMPLARRGGALTAAFVRGPLKIALHFVAAFLLLFAEWGYEPLAAVLAKLSRFLVFARLEAWMVSLPPYGALALFAAPALCLLPIKLLALYLLATGHPAFAVGLIIAAKVIGTAVVARIYMLVKLQLMEIGWFRQAHDTLIPWQERMFAEIRSSAAWRAGRIARVEVKRGANRVWIGFLPQRRLVRAWIEQAKGEFKGFVDDLRRALG